MTTARSGSDPAGGLALLAGCAAALLPLVAAVGVRGGLWSWRFGAETLGGEWSFYAAVAATATTVVILLIGLVIRRRVGPLTLIGLAAALAALAWASWARTETARQPPIHDVATDWADPVMFSKGLVADRTGAANAVEADPVVGPGHGSWSGRRVAEINAQTCPGAHKIAAMADADAAAAAVEKLGGQVIGQDTIRVEALFSDGLFGARSDVAIRIRPGETDIRSVDRDRDADGGANCRRVTALVQALSR